MAGRHRGVCAGRLGTALRHRAGGRSPGGGHAAAERRARAGYAGLLAGALGARRHPLPVAVPAPADGPERCLSYRRPVQPVRVFRGAARRIVRTGTARFGARAREGRHALHRGQPGGFVRLPDRRSADLWRHRNPQHGRTGAARRAVERP